MTMLCEKIAILALFCAFVCQGQEIIGGVVQDRPEMDTCIGAAGPRPVTGLTTPGKTDGMTVDDVNGGFCGVDINGPGIWWLIQGTGQPIRASSCSPGTEIKVAISVFTGSCDELRCVTGGSTADFECDLEGKWGSISTAVDFETREFQNYYILVQQMGNTPGNVWMSFRQPNYPVNNDCLNAMGPIPRDGTLIDATSTDANLDTTGNGCTPPDFPGVWFQFFGTGKQVTLEACSEFNYDGYVFNVYNAADCFSLGSCVSGGNYGTLVDSRKCQFGPGFVQTPLTTYTIPTKDGDRYYVLVSYDSTQSFPLTSNFRFFIDDGESGRASNGGHVKIQFAKWSEEDFAQVAPEANN